MNVKETFIKGLFVIEPIIHTDVRGYFFESFNKKILHKAGLTNDFVQDNEAFSFKGALRGLHYQTPPMAQTKLVRVVKGKVIDVVVDIREGSETYGKWYSIELSGKNKKQLYIPKGFAHGYLTVSKKAVFAYKCDNYYSREHEAGILWNDPTLGINWNFPAKKIILSEKDQKQAVFGKHKKFKI